MHETSLVTKKRATNPKTGGRATRELAGNDPRTAGHGYVFNLVGVFVLLVSCVLVSVGWFLSDIATARALNQLLIQLINPSHSSDCPRGVLTTRKCAPSVLSVCEFFRTSRFVPESLAQTSELSALPMSVCPSSDRQTSF